VSTPAYFCVRSSACCRVLGFVLQTGPGCAVLRLPGLA
jgi:hypothetical protein